MSEAEIEAILRKHIYYSSYSGTKGYEKAAAEVVKYITRELERENDQRG